MAVLLLLAAAGCGKRGPPLPPLVKLPAAPADFRAERRGATVDLQLTVPAANTDNTRPANLSRIDVYAITAREPVTDAQILKQGTRVASVRVKAPRDPEKTIDADESPADMEPPEGEGLDQGAIARAAEELTGPALQPAERRDANGKPAQAAAASPAGPLLAPGPRRLSRTYVAVGVSTRERRGPMSRRIAVPLVPPPPPPASPTVTYDESAISVAWAPIAGRPPVQAAPADGELESTPIGVPASSVAYNVYDTTATPASVRLTESPIAEAAFSDKRIAWGAERCYTVRAVETIDGVEIESAAPPPSCKTLRDTFPPKPPAHLQSSPGEGAVSLIWDANAEPDLAGYLVLRGPSSDALTPITDAPIRESTFVDRVPAGQRFTYAVKAVDRAGNASPPSNAVEEAAR